MTTTGNGNYTRRGDGQWTYTTTGDNVPGAEDHAEPIGMYAPELHVSVLVDVAEAAVMLGVRPASVSTLRARGDMPPPVATINGGAVWTRPIIEQWIASRPGRGTGGGRPRKSV